MAKKNLIEPMGNRVLVKPCVVGGGEHIKGGIVIPETSTESNPREGIVAAVGKGVDAGVYDFEVGDKVLLPRHGGLELKVLGEAYLLFPTDDLVVRIHG